MISLGRPTDKGGIRTCFFSFLLVDLMDQRKVVISLGAQKKLIKLTRVFAGWKMDHEDDLMNPIERRDVLLASS